MCGRECQSNVGPLSKNFYRQGQPQCTLLVNPKDAAPRQLVDGEIVTLSSAAGAVDVPVQITNEIIPGVVSLPHGWGHNRDGVRLRVAARHPGASINDVTDEHLVDALTGTAALSGVPVTVTAHRTANETPERQTQPT